MFYFLYLYVQILYPMIGKSLLIGSILLSMTTVSFGTGLQARTSFQTDTNKAKYLSLPDNPLTIGTKPEQIEGKIVQTDKNITTENLQGKIVLLDFWFIGCKACITAIPHLNNLRKKYPADKVAIIGINPTTESIDAIKKLIDQYAIAYDIAITPGNFIFKYSVGAFPTLYILDKSGTIIDVHTGINESTMEERVSKIIDSHL